MKKRQVPLFVGMSDPEPHALYLNAPKLKRLTKAQKAKIVEQLLDAAGNMAEFWDEVVGKDVPAKEGALYLAKLMKRVAGDQWDDRLPEVDKK